MNSTGSNKPAGTPASMDNAALLKKYGKVSGFRNKLKERKYFDSGDYAMNKAGMENEKITTGIEHPSPDSIPHHAPVVGMQPEAPTAAPVHPGVTGRIPGGVPGKALGGAAGRVPAGVQDRAPGMAPNPLLQRGPAVATHGRGVDQTSDAGPTSPLRPRFRSSLSKEAEIPASDSEDQKD